MVENLNLRLWPELFCPLMCLFFCFSRGLVVCTRWICRLSASCRLAGWMSTSEAPLKTDVRPTLSARRARAPALARRADSVGPTPASEMPLWHNQWLRPTPHRHNPRCHGNRTHDCLAISASLTRTLPILTVGGIWPSTLLRDARPSVLDCGNSTLTPSPDPLRHQTLPECWRSGCLPGNSKDPRHLCHQSQDRNIPDVQHRILNATNKQSHDKSTRCAAANTKSHRQVILRKKYPVCSTKYWMPPTSNPTKEVPVVQHQILNATDKQSHDKSTWCAAPNTECHRQAILRKKYPVCSTKYWMPPTSNPTKEVPVVQHQILNATDKQSYERSTRCAAPNTECHRQVIPRQK